jgi:hypothetical protein
LAGSRFSQPVARGLQLETGPRWYEPLVVPGLLQTEDYARAILSARPDGNLADLDEQVAARLARQADLDGKPSVVYLETAAEGIVTDSPSAVNHVALRFDRLRAQAESWVASRDLIRKVAEERWT